MTGLFARVMGSDFEALAPAVRRVHGGRAVLLRGTVTVTRGPSFIARLMCWFGRLPQAQQHAAARVKVDVVGDRERWTREFGTSGPMRSMLGKRDACVVERLGPLALWFQLNARDGAVIWTPLRATLFGIPVARRWLSGITAGASEKSGRYRFDVAIVLPLIGAVIAYRGEIDHVNESD